MEMTETLGGRKSIVMDAACLVLITVVSAAPYITSLGFYSDDWALLETFDRGRTSFGAVVQDFAVRPLQGIYAATLFRLFGFHPLGYHLVNTAMIALAVALFHLLLLRLRFSRSEALSAALLFIVLPQLSTIRVWFSTVQVALSMALALSSMHAQLSYVRSGHLAWGAVAVIAALLSLAAYEVFAPLVVAFPIVLFLARRQLFLWDEVGRDSRRLRAIIVVILVVGAAAILLKMIASDRARSILYPGIYAQGIRTLFDPGYDFRLDSGPNIFAAVQVHFGLTLAGWRDAGVEALGGDWNGWAVVSALACAVMTAWRIGSSDQQFRSTWLLAAGLVVFTIGHAALFGAAGLTFSGIGMANRVLAAPAVGVALILAAGLAALSNAFPQRIRWPLFCIAMAAIVATGAYRIWMIERYWIEAPRLQARFLDGAKRDLRSVPPESTVIVAGLCPYHGPAVVFETWWDTGPALSLTLGRKLEADLLSRRSQVARSGLRTWIYGDSRLYPFGPNLFLYNPVVRSHVPLSDFEVARSAVARWGGTWRNCPPGKEGQGVFI
jgi:hypothetical protein